MTPTLGFMRRFLLRLALVVPAIALLAAHTAVAHEFNVLVFSKTAAFRHGSIEAGLTAIQELAAAHGFDVTATENADAFTAALPNHHVVVFLNTTGDVLSDAQQTAFQNWYRAGGGYVGIHAASDTEHGWPWYGSLVGAEFTSHPAVQQAQVKFLDRVHPITNVIDSATSERVERWTYTDEWYNFVASPRGNVHVLAVLDESSYTGGTHGNDHPIAWCREFEGGRSAYLASGHTDASYSDPIFRGLITNAIKWAAGELAGDSGAAIHANYQKTVLENALVNPMSIDVAQDGAVYLVERGGLVKRHRQTTGITATIGTLDVYTGGEFGALALALAPGFDPNVLATQHLYFMYSPNPANSTRTRISRFSLDSAGFLNLASEVVILDFFANRPSNHGGSGHHQGGALRFDISGNLFVSIGDNTDASGYSPRSASDIMKDARKTAPNTNDVRGKILRIRPNIGGGPPEHPNYTIPAGNLFPVGTPKTRPEIYMMGCRNPFRFCIDPHTGWLYEGNVGPDAATDGTAASQGPRGHDEFNQVRAAGWFGWPYFIADNKPYLDGNAAPWTMASLRTDLAAYFTQSWFLNNGGVAGDPNLLPAPQPAWIWYGKNQTDAKFSEFGVSSESTAMPGAVFKHQPGSNFPQYHDKTVFLMEWSRNLILEVKTDRLGNILEITRFAPNLTFAHPHDMVFGPDGAMYLIEWNTNALTKVQYTKSNKIPIAAASANVTSGGVPLVINFSGAGSSDPEDNANVSYAWDFNGDGLTDSTAPHPQHTYSTAGTYLAQLTVTDSQGLSARSTVVISVGNHAPVLSFTQPGNGFFDWGDQVAFGISVTDAEDGSTAGGQIRASDVLFEGALGHADHQHNESQQFALSGVVSIPRDDGHAFSENLTYVLDAFYTDKGGPGVSPLTGTVKAVLQPKITMGYTFDAQSGVTTSATSDPVGGSLDVSGIDHGDYIMYRNLNLAGITAIRAHASAAGNGGLIKVRQDSLTGPVLATIAVTPTGSASAYADFTAPITDPGGAHDLYFVFENAPGATNLMRLNWLNFRGAGVSWVRGLPSIKKVEVLSPTQYQLIFDQIIDKATGSNPANYTIENGGSITGVTLSANQTSVIVTTSPVAPGSYRLLSLNGVEDLAGDPIAANSLALIVGPVQTTPETPDFLYGINCGGRGTAARYVDAEGRIYEPDPHSNGAAGIFFTTNAIAGTTDDKLYQTERNNNGADTLTYNIRVPKSGLYRVTLKFAEIFFTAANQRKFDVAVEGVTLATDLDIYAVAGYNKAYDLGAVVNVTDGSLVVALAPGTADRPKISAIYVESADSSGRYFGINAGGPAYTSVADGTPYLADAFFTPSNAGTSSTTGSIAGANGDDTLYQTERYMTGTLTYNLPIENGTYEVVLQYAEIWTGATSAGTRSFNVFLEGVSVAPSPLDLTATAGYRTAYAQTRTVTVTDGSLTVRLNQVPGRNNPKINAIKVRRLLSSSVVLPAGFFTWLQSHPGKGVSPYVDFENDGISAVAEYALGGNPGTSDQNILPSLMAAAAGEYNYVFERPLGLSDVAYRIFGSDDLGSWVQIFPTNAVQNLGNGLERVTFQNLRAAAQAAGLTHAEHIFFRLGMELVPAP